MAMLTPAHVDVVDLLLEERAELIGLLGELSSEQWAAATECPAWSVKGIALHLLGDDVSLLSRQRDEEPPGVVVETAGSTWDDLMASLDAFNERWVETASFLSPMVITELLRITGDWTQRWYASVDPNQLGETIHWISPTDPQPYWLLAAREYLERWIHHLQIRRAVNAPGLTDARYVTLAVAITLRGFPRGLAAIPAPPDATVMFTITDAEASWTLQSTANGWVLHDGAPSQPTVRLDLDLNGAAHLFSRGLLRSEVDKHVVVDGQSDLAHLLVTGLAAFFGRER